MNKDGVIDFEEFKEHMMGLIKKGNFKYRKNCKSQ